MFQALFAVAASALIAWITPTALLPTQAVYTKPSVVLILKEDVQEANDTTIILKNEDAYLELPMEEYIIGVVFSEMPASFHEEALKAQSVAARTFTAARLEKPKHTDCTVCSDSACCQAWIDTESLKEKMGDKYEVYYNKIKNAVIETAGEVLTYNGELIEALYFSCTDGRTEPAAAVWGSDVPYLQSVKSEEQDALRFKSETIIPVSEFVEILMTIDKSINTGTTSDKWVENVVYTEGGGVKQIEICDRLFTGTELRKAFGLNSTAFELEIDDDQAVFCVKGYGHRVGMSQYGANTMAENGDDYQTILKYYYQGVEIKK